MRAQTKLEDVYKATTSCLRCSMCTYGEWPNNHVICPMYFYDKCFTYSGGGFMYLAKSLIEKRLSFDSEISDFLYTCPGCLACNDICEVIPCSEPYTAPFDIIRLMRREAVKKGVVTDQRLKEILKENENFKEAVVSNTSNVLRIPANIYDEGSDKVLFLEWTLMKPQNKIYQSVLRILEKVGEPISGVSDRGLNFPELYDFGFWEDLEKYLGAKFDARVMEGKELIFVNPHFQEFIGHRYSEIVPGHKNIKVRHISEVLLDALKKGKLKRKKAVGKIKLSYHDPCYLGRGLKIYDAPREVLSLIDGTELIEMERNRRDSFCCGARAGNNYFSDFSKKIILERLNEFKRTKADLLITACPYCKTTFQKWLRKAEQYKVMDLTEFVEQHLE